MLQAINKTVDSVAREFFVDFCKGFHQIEHYFLIAELGKLDISEIIHLNALF